MDEWKYEDELQNDMVFKLDLRLWQIMHFYRSQKGNRLIYNNIAKLFVIVYVSLRFFRMYDDSQHIIPLNYTVVKRAQKEEPKSGAISRRRIG